MSIPTIVLGNKLNRGVLKIYGTPTGSKESVTFIYAPEGDYNAVHLILPSNTDEGFIYNDGSGNLSFQNFSYTMGTGPRSSMVDAGVFGEMSLTDDYLYICVQTGIAGSAIWKRLVMFNTP